MKNSHKLLAIFAFISEPVFAISRFGLYPYIFQNGLHVKQGYLSVGVTGSQNTGYGIYDAEQSYVPSPSFFTNSVDITGDYGLTDKWDFLFAFNYTQNKSSLKRFDHIGDTSFTLSYQISNQWESKFKANSSMQISLLIPTGKFNNLNPALYTTDATGGGTYQPAVSFSFDKSFDFKSGRSMSIYALAGLTYSTKVKLSGLSAYGGSSSTVGRIRPGNAFNFGAGAIYNASEKISLTVEYDVFTQQPSTFKGQVASDFASFIQSRRQNLSSSTGAARYVRPRILFNDVLPTTHNIGGNNFIGSGAVTVLSISPTITYNYDNTLNISFTMSSSVPGGKNATGFYSPMLTFSKTYSPSQL